MKNLQYIDILREFEDFFNRHLMVTEFVAGKMYDFSARENKYSAVVVAPTMSSISSTSESLGFDLYFIDRVVEDGSNLNDVFSSELLIVQDFVAYFSNRNGTWNLDGENISIDPIYKQFDDIVAGWQLSVSVSLPFYKNICEIPMRDAQPIPLAPVADFTAYISGRIVTIVNKSLYFSELSWEYDGANVQDLQGSDLVRLEYVQSGTYTITLTAKNDGFPESICTKTITIL